MQIQFLKNAIFGMDDEFTVNDVVQALEKANLHQDIDSMLVISYLSKLARSGLVEQSGRHFWFNRLECLGKHERVICEDRADH